MKQLTSFVKKEFLHILRDPLTMLILIVMPVVLILLFGFAITTEVKNSRFAVLDESHDIASENLVNRLDASEYFSLYGYVDNIDEANQWLKEGRVGIVIVVPGQYAATPDSQVQLILDACNPNEATQLTQYANVIITRAKAEEYSKLGIKQGGIISDTQLLYNPMMKGAYNFVPGVMGLILILICALMSSVSIVKESEMGTMEVLLVSPMKPFVMIVAKSIPYLSISIINVATILLLSRFVLDVPIRGSELLLVSISILYSFVALCLGLLISTIAKTQEVAMLLCALTLMLPVVLLSGMVFPIENMPLPLQWLSQIIPAKWYITAVKDIMIKGLGFASVARHIGILILMAIILLTLSVKRFKTRLE